MVTMDSLENISIRRRTWKKTGFRFVLLGAFWMLWLWWLGCQVTPPESLPTRTELGRIFQTIWTTHNSGPQIGTLSQGRFVREAHSDREISALQHHCLCSTSVIPGEQSPHTHLGDSKGAVGRWSWGCHRGGFQLSMCGSHQSGTWGKC